MIAENKFHLKVYIFATENVHWCNFVFFEMLEMQATV